MAKAMKSLPPLPNDWGRLANVLGLEVVARGRGRVQMRLPWSRPASQMAGLLHGGALFTLADTAAAVGILPLLAPGWTTVTATLSISYIGNIHQGAALADARMLHFGRKTTVWEIKIREEGKRRLLAVATGTFFLLPPKL